MHLFFHLQIYSNFIKIRGWVLEHDAKEARNQSSGLLINKKGGKEYRHLPQQNSLLCFTPYGTIIYYTILLAISTFQKYHFNLGGVSAK
jgi:hypothetical protein